MYDALDAHGHAIDPQRITCKTCLIGIESDGYCPACRIGYIQRKAYLSRLTYYVAKGSVISASRLTCDRCLSHCGRTGWCDTCSVGIVGNVAHGDRADFDALAEEYGKVVSAVSKLDQCESCAVASLTNGRCIPCRVVFENGEAKALARP
jgi:hypothetical protein